MGRVYLFPILLYPSSSFSSFVVIFSSLIFTLSSTINYFVSVESLFADVEAKGC